MSYTIYCHPDNMKLLKDELAKVSRPTAGFPGLVIGDPIVASSVVPKRNIRREWQPPAWPFCTIEPRDHEWLKRLGFGTIIEIDEGPAFWRMKNYEFPRYMPIMHLSA